MFIFPLKRFESGSKQKVPSIEDMCSINGISVSHSELKMKQLLLLQVEYMTSTYVGAS